ncbi:NADH:flavin oxidoreductase [Maridesulfovibrio sp.]|uniref:NADH:flavin oxidoreductase n=1 Tax=unclassified Maridesulfovibrio TaxID=2794999 RepID=UPI003B00A361
MTKKKTISRRSMLKTFGMASVATVGLGCAAISRQAEAAAPEETRRMYKVYSNGQIGSMKLKNRFIKAATLTESTNADGRFLPQGLEIYRNWSKGGVAMIESGHMSVVPFDYHGITHHPAQIWDDKHIPYMKELVGAVRSGNKDCKFVAFLNHLGNHPKLVHGQGVSASNVGWPGQKKVAPKTLNVEEINETTDAFAAAAVRAQKAGFDGVELQGGHHFLLHSFISPQTNKRTDRYGGSTENRVRIVAEIVEKIKKKVGPDFPILIKVNSFDGGPGGIELDTFPEVAKAISKTGIDAMELSGGNPSVPDIEDPTEQSYHAKYAKKIDVDVPVILTGGNKDIDIMERLYNPGKIDFFALARPLIRQPDLPNFWISKKNDPECTCESCNECLRYHVFEGNPFLTCQLD